MSVDLPAVPRKARTGKLIISLFLLFIFFVSTLCCVGSTNLIYFSYLDE